MDTVPDPTADSAKDEELFDRILAEIEAERAMDLGRASPFDHPLDRIDADELNVPPAVAPTPTGPDDRSRETR